MNPKTCKTICIVLAILIVLALVRAATNKGRLYGAEEHFRSENRNRAHERQFLDDRNNDKDMQKILEEQLKAQKEKELQLENRKSLTQQIRDKEIPLTDVSQTKIIRGLR